LDYLSAIPIALIWSVSWTTLEMSVLVNALAKELPEYLPTSLSDLMADPERNAKKILSECVRTFASLSPEGRSRVAKHAEALARC
jgi:nitrate reductase assembly molybdenum cofactor insertion protein NarJ